MKSYRDLLFTLVLAILSVVWYTVPILNSDPLYLTPYLLLILVLPGYALPAIIKPLIYKDSFLKKAIYSLNLSLIISLLVYLLLTYTRLGKYNIPLLVVLAFLTIFLAIVALMRRMLYKIPSKDEVTAKKVKAPSKRLGPDDDVAVRVTNVSMEFNLSTEKVDNIKEYIIKLLKRELFYHEFWALKNVSFEIKKGEKLGIIGLNGAGKSTLLKLISGVMKPTEGTIEVNGGVVPLLELGGGFNANYTGRENIYLRGALLGYSRDFMESKFDEIVDFSELGDFIDVPVKNYSSGMTSRLGFSISTIVQPQILILDEVLAVGDAKFREKSQERMNSFLSRDTTVLLVSHSMSQVKNLCNTVIWLEKGKLVMEGPAEEVCDGYLESIKQGA